MPFFDRKDAGHKLGRALLAHRLEDPVVLALPRGGLAVAAEIAIALGSPLGVVLVRKIGTPRQPEVALGAIAEGPSSVIVRNDEVIAKAGISSAEFDRLGASARRELDHRRRIYLEGRPRTQLVGKTVVVVDDGVATGATMRAALQAVRAWGPGSVVLATPVASRRALRELAAEADLIVCLEAHADFSAVGAYYAVFDQLSDQQALAILDKFNPRSDELRHIPIVSGGR